MNMVTQMILTGINDLAEQNACTLALNPLSNTRGTGYVYRGLGKTELTLVYDFLPDRGECHLVFYPGTVNPCQPKNQKPLVTMNAGYHEIEKLALLGEVLKKLLTPRQPEQRSVPLPDDLLEKVLANTATASK